MVQVNNFYFLQNATSATETDVTHNASGETLTLQVDGDASAFSFQIKGCVDLMSDEFYQLSGLDLDFNTSKTITKTGIYTFGVDGISKLKLKLDSISGGSITVFAKITKGV